MKVTSMCIAYVLAFAMSSFSILTYAGTSTSVSNITTQGFSNTHSNSRTNYSEHAAGIKHQESGGGNLVSVRDSRYIRSSNDGTRTHSVEHTGFSSSTLAVNAGNMGRSYTNSQAHSKVTGKTTGSNQSTENGVFRAYEVSHGDYSYEIGSYTAQSGGDFKTTFKSNSDRSTTSDSSYDIYGN